MNFPQRSTLYRGDNLDVLRRFDSETFDLIYLDPPFNTKKPQRKGKSAYRDTWRWTDVDEYALAYFATYHPGAARYISALVDMGATKGMQSYAAFMAPRLLEIHRVLKRTGSMYLHCDYRANMVLRHLCDAIFGESAFRNEIVWRKYAGRKNNATRKFSTGHDVIYFYGKSKEARFEPVYIPHSEKEKNKEYNKVDSDGRRYRLSRGRSYQLHGIQKRLYLDESKGRMVNTLWTEDGLQLNTSTKEGQEYPTQKPLNLMYRILDASSSQGDRVLDPFCGCASMPVAAANRGRQWVGIDTWEKAAEMVTTRLHNPAIGEVLFNATEQFADCIADPSKLPVRTDVEPCRKRPADRERLLLAQGGVCVCGKDLREMDSASVHFDRIIPSEDGPGYVYGNVQMLCASCNLSKGRRPMSYLLAKLNQREFAFGESVMKA